MANKDIGLSITAPRDTVVQTLGGPTSSSKKATEKRLKSVRDSGKKMRTSIEIDEDEHRRFKIYLANQQTTFRDDILKHIRKCIKDID